MNVCKNYITAFGKLGHWMDGWMDGEAGLRIAYSNQKQITKVVQNKKGCSRSNR